MHLLSSLQQATTLNPLLPETKTQKPNSEGVNLQGDADLRRHKQTPFSPKAMAFRQPASEPTYFIAHQSEEMFIRSSKLSVCTDEAAIVPADLTLE